MAASVTRDGEPKISAGDEALPANRLERAIGAVERNSVWALSGLMLLAGVLVLYMGRGLSFFYDDWDFVTHDYGGGLHSLLAAHSGNISVFPIAIYKLLFHLVGLNHYGVFRLVVVILHLICGALVFVLAARRVPRVLALLAAALILFLGAAWEDLLWAFQMGYLLSVAAGLAAWVLLDREDRRWDPAAMLCLIVAAGSSSLGLAIMIGVAVELAWQRDWRRGWIVLVPAFLYLLWYLGYGESQVTRNGLINTPGFAEDLAAAAFGGLVGRALDWGRPLALLGVVVLLRELTRSRAASPRLAGLLATGVSLWIITAAARSTISSPEASRYVYLGAVVIVMAGVEALRGIKVSPTATALATSFVAIGVLAGLTVMHNGAVGLRATSRAVTAELGALEMAAAHAPTAYRPDPVRAPQIMAGPYLHTVRAIGSSPADTPAEVAAADPASRASADSVLVVLGVPTLTPLGSAKPSPSAPAPVPTSLVGGSAVKRGGCVDLVPRPGVSMVSVLTLPSGGVTIRNLGPEPASLAVRRFGDVFDPLAGPVTAHNAVALSISRDAAAVPWQLQATSLSTLSICGLPT